MSLTNKNNIWFQLVLIIFLASFTKDKDGYEILKSKSKEIKSYSSDDYNDLKFLNNYIKDKRIVYLGESTHYAKEITLFKNRIIKYLHENLNFEILAIESPMAEMKFLIDVNRPKEIDSIIKNGTLRMFHNEDFKATLDYSISNKLNLVGLDIQIQSKKVINEYLRNGFNQVVPDSIIRSLIQLDSIFLISDLTQKNKLRKKLYEMYEKTIKLYNSSLKTEQLTLNQKIFVRVLENRKFLTSSYGKNYSSTIRDSLMAENLNWYYKNVYKNKKIIVWAHNYHIMKNYPTIYNSNSKIMAAEVDSEIAQQSYNIGIYCYSGKVLFNSKIRKIDKPSKGSLEFILKQSGYEITYLDVSNPEDFKSCSWYYKPVAALYNGFKVDDRFIIKDCFDAIVSLKKVQPTKILY
ncbi:MAG: erythromycin esterase family protein [Bacteroidota bacterium]